MAAPYQVKFCYELNKYFETEFWFYKHIESSRPNWWKISLGDKCKVLKNSFFLPLLNYNSFGILNAISKYDPDIVLLGGFFFPSHFLIKRWAKKNDKVIIIANERIEYENLSPIKRIFKKLYYTVIFKFFQDIDAFFALGSDVTAQHINVFGYKSLKYISYDVRYAQDIDTNLVLTKELDQECTRILFPNRLIKKYNPLFVLAVFKELCRKHDNLVMHMNAEGDLRDGCEKILVEYNLEEKVFFIDSIKDWNDLPALYSNSDVSIFACTDSNGPNTLIESMAAGMGVVMCNTILNTHEYAIDSLNCFKVEYEIDAFVNAIEKYISKPDLIVQHGLISKKLVYQRSIEGTAIFYKEILEKIYNERTN